MWEVSESLTSILSLGIPIGITLLITLILLRVNASVFKRIRKKNTSVHISFISKAISGLIVLSGLWGICAQIPELNKFMTTIMASSGIAAVAISFAAQESLSNIVSGVFISVFHLFDIGDRVHLNNSNVTGYIEDITLRHTVVRTVNNSRIVVPNSIMNKEVVENSNMHDTRCAAFVDVGVDYACDIQEALSVFRGICENYPLVIDTRKLEDIEAGKPKVNVLIRELASDSINLRATIWTANLDDSFKACSDIRFQLLTEFKKQGIVIPFRQITVSTR